MMDARFRGFLEAAPDAVVIADAGGVIVNANAQAEKLFGIPRRELLGQRLTALVPVRFRVHPSLRAASVAAPPPRALGAWVQLFGLRRDGTEVPIELSVSLLDTDDGPLVSATIRDISDRLALEARFETLYREAQEANRLKDEFLATVSHELRTPLNAMLGWARILRTGSLDEDKTAHALDVIERSALSQAQLIEDLLDTSRIVAGTLRLDMRAYVVADVVGAAVDALRPAMDAKGLHLARYLEPELAPLVGDPDRLQQVIWNILTNATKFSLPGGRIWLSVRRRGDGVVLSIKDEGRGIPSAFLPRVFDRFARADEALTRQEKGLGLGLALARAVVELHGGTVEAQSAGEGLGLTFTVTLPSAFAAHVPRPFVLPAPLATLDRPPELADLRVLVVEDEEDARKMLVETLRRCGAIAVGVGSASSALLDIEATLPDVILSDIGLPGEDGYAFIRKLRAREPERGGKIPAAALTAFLGAEERRRAFAAGFQLHVGKPIDPTELVQTVAHLARIAGR